MWRLLGGACVICSAVMYLCAGCVTGVACMCTPRCWLSCCQCCARRWLVHSIIHRNTNKHTHTHLFCLPSTPLMLALAPTTRKRFLPQVRNPPAHQRGGYGCGPGAAARSVMATHARQPRKPHTTAHHTAVPLRLQGLPRAPSIDACWSSAPTAAARLGCAPADQCGRPPGIAPG